MQADPWLQPRSFVELPTQVRAALQPSQATQTQLQADLPDSPCASLGLTESDMPPTASAKSTPTQSTLATFVSGLESFFAVTAQPQTKKKRESTSKGGSPVDDDSASLEPPLTKPQAQWIQEAVGGAFGAFGAHMQVKLGSADADIRALDARTTETKQQTDTQAREIEALSKRLQDVESAPAHSSSLPPGLAAPSPASPWAAWSPAVVVPYEHRMEAIIANLGWDAPGDKIVANARSVLDKAGVAAEDYANLVPLSRHKGSAAILSFTSHELLQKARRQVDAFQASFDENNASRKVRLDAKKRAQ